MTLSDYMAKKEMTEAQMAALVGCSQSTINRIKSGRFAPGLDLMVRVSVATHGKVTPNDFAETLRAIERAPLNTRRDPPGRPCHSPRR